MVNDVVQILAPCLVFGTAITIPVSIAWFEHRTRKRGLDTLRIYAERGEEPPASVIEAVTKVTNVYGNPQPAWGTPHPPAKPQTRANHLAHAAASTVIAMGLAGLVWWRVSAYNEKGAGIIIAILVALFFAGSVAASIHREFHTPVPRIRELYSAC
jgi:hypothetical protein